MSMESDQAAALPRFVFFGISLEDKRVERLCEFLLYGMSSGLALALDYGLLIFLTDYCGLYYLVSSAISFSAGLLLVYGMSVTVVFRHRRFSSRSSELWGFIATGIAGLVLNQVLLFGFTVASPMSYRLAKLPTAGLVFLFNYVVRRGLLFSPKI